SRSKKARILRTSVMSGTRCRITGSRVSSVPQRIGNTAFLLAEGVMAPFSARPPWTIRLVMPGPFSGDGRGSGGLPGADFLRLGVADRLVRLGVVLFGQEAHRLQGGHAAHAGGGHRLAVDV